MRIKKHKENRKNKLRGEIVEYFVISLIIAVFTFCFLYFTSESIGERYFYTRNIVIGENQKYALHMWMQSLCIAAGGIVFLTLFLTMLGQRIAYLVTIIKEVECLQESQMDHVIPLDGHDELTQLAESINYLWASQQEISRKELKLKEEREMMIRSLSHDIRTPLTSMLSYSEFMKSKETFDTEEMHNYIELIQTKAFQIKNMTDQLLNHSNEKKEKLENIKLFLEQLVFEWEEILEEQFRCSTDMEQCCNMSGYLNVDDLRRIFDNLLSNVEKYGDRNETVELKVSGKDGKICIFQKNGIAENSALIHSTHKIGLENVRTIAEKYKGSADIIREDRVFEIKIVLYISAEL